MSSTSADRLPIVEEVVTTLTSAAGSGYGGAEALRAGMRRATDQFDEHAAAALSRALVDTLCQAPDDVRVLETLVILGLAHPGALSQHRISLASEGRRLAVLLEQAGQFERAYCLNELITERAPIDPKPLTPAENTAVERLVRDAELAAAKGRGDAAIKCLEEADRLDPGRSDVLRAIRDLRRRRDFKKESAFRSVRLLLGVIFVSCLATALVVREVRVWHAWKAVPTSEPKDLASMRSRLAGIEALLARERYWCTMPAALLDRDVLRHDIALAERPIPPLLTDVPQAQAPGTERVEEAEQARLSGLRNAEKGLIDEALADLKRALALAPPDWAHREKIQANVAALEAWQRKNR